MIDYSKKFKLKKVADVATSDCISRKISLLTFAVWKIAVYEFSAKV